MHVRCPHCRNAIEIVGDDGFCDVTCPSCGSTFNFLPETEAHTAGAARQSLATRTIGHFQLLEQLGTGGFGTVWKAKDTELDRFVAVKIPRRDQVEPENVEMFLREARAAAQLKHPQIVAVHEVGRDDGTLYIVSDFIAGITLADRLTQGLFTPHEATELCAQIGHALHHAHEVGVIHRDLKPQNIMLDGAGCPHIMDFGLAKREAGEITMTADGKIMGTAAYMSPEQARGEAHRADRRTDVYSLGVILYELLTGERPFRGNRAMLLHQVIHDEPPSPRKLNSRLPRDLETVAIKCLEKDPRRRYPTALEVSNELRRHLSGLPIHARPINKVERAWRWSRRNPAGAALLATLAIGFLTATGLASWALVERNRAGAAALTARTKATEAIQSAGKEAKERKKAEEQKDLANRAADAAWAMQYIAHANRIEIDWQNANLGRIHDTLDFYRQPPPSRKDLRGWEWHFQERLCNQEVRSFPGHSKGIASVAFSPDGTRLASASYDQTVKLWDTVTGKEVRTLRGHTGSIERVAFSPDGTKLATASADQTIKLWEAATGQEIHVLIGHTAVVYGVAFSPDAAILASAHRDQTIKLWDVKTGQEIRTLKGHVGGVLGVAFGPRGIRLASAGGENSVKLWNVNTGEEVRTFQGHTDGVFDIAFSPDGARFVSGGQDGTVKLWNSFTGQTILTLSGHTREVRSVAFSPDGRQLASASWDQTVKLWDANTGEQIRDLRAFKGDVQCVAFHPDGMRLAAAGSDQTVKLWSVASDQQIRIMRGHTAGLYGVAFSPDSSQVASASVDRTVKLWDTTTGQEIRTFRGHTAAVQSIAYSPDGLSLASASFDRTLKQWDVATGRELRTFRGHTHIVGSVAFSPDATLLASASIDQSIRLWNAATGDMVRELRGHQGAVLRVAFSIDGRRLASGGADQTVKLWDVTTGKELKVLTGHTRGVLSVAFSRNGALLATSSGDGRLNVWNHAKGEVLHTLKHATMVQDAAFNADASRLATVTFGGDVILWDVSRGQELRTLSREARRVYGVAFSPDGTRLAAASNDNSLTVWDARPLTPEIRAEIEAVSLLEILFAKPLPADAVVDYIRHDKLLSEAARQQALQLAKRFHEETDPKKYHDAAWPVVRHPHSNVFMCRFAVAQLREACKRATEQPQYRLALGIAQYRLGKFEKEHYSDALETMSKCDPSDPATQFVLSMVHVQLGDTVLARELFEQAVQAMEKGGKNDPDLNSLRAEAASLLKVAES